MKPEKYAELLKKLNSHILHHGGDVKSPLSPTTRPVASLGSPGTLFKSMDFEHMSKNELQLVHANLHRFYPRGIGDIDKKTIERLHREVKEKLHHVNFDSLDEK